VNQNYQYFHCIIEEIIRFRKKINAEGIKNISENEEKDYLCSLNHPAHGMIIIGCQANKRFYELANLFSLSFFSPQFI
jgi:hypothetical protein